MFLETELSLTFDEVFVSSLKILISTVRWICVCGVTVYLLSASHLHLFCFSVFSQGLKKSSLELYGLICYGELRKKIGGCEYDLKLFLYGRIRIVYPWSWQCLVQFHFWVIQNLCSLYSIAVICGVVFSLDIFLFLKTFLVCCISPLFLWQISLAFAICGMQCM